MNVKNVARILIVDDEFDLRRNLKSILDVHFTDVVMVATCADAINELKSKEYDVIVCDYKVNEEYGTEIRKWQMINQPNCQFILMTGYADDPGIVQHLETDYFKVLQKPVESHELIIPLLKDFPTKKAS